ncbi:MAG: Ig-like domain-containing protein, partial [Clostridia bacterium]|nr:Ig-like domain-containing protein [Clostridia bacterium]
MKKKFFVSLLLVVLIFLLAATVLVACNKDLIEYSITVTYNDEPVEGVTVKWSEGGKVKGSAKTDANGRAAVMLKSGTYSVDLADYADGLTYSRINSVTPSMRDKWTIALKLELIDYTVTVTDKDGNPANGVVVNYLVDNQIKGTTTTAANGVATCALPKGEYGVRPNLFSLPDFNVLESGKTYSVSTNSPSTSVNLVYGNTITYTVTVRSEGGLRFKGANVLIDDKQGNNVDNDFADEEGVFRTRLEPNDYVADLFSAPDGYT